MKILFLCHRVPYPPDKGDKIRAFHQLRALGERHEVHLFTLADQESDLAHKQALEQYCSQVTIARLNPSTARLLALPYLLTRRALTLPYFYSNELARQIRDARRRHAYDRVYVYCSSMAQYILAQDTMAQSTDGGVPAPVIVDLVDVDSDKWAQYANRAPFPFSAVYRREARCLRRFEREVCERAARVLITTEREANLVREICPGASVEVVANGVDTEYFSPASSPPDPAKPFVVFTGDMSYFPNEEAVTFFAQQVLPLLRHDVPNLGFLIVGRQPTLKVKKLAAIPGVEVTGFVADVRTHLARAVVSVAPFSIAAGIQNKVLEAMSCGLPVVATSRVVGSLAPTVAEVVDSGDSAEELAACVLRLLKNPAEARSQGLEGRRRVAAAYNWPEVLLKLVRLVEGPANEQVTGGVAGPKKAGTTS